MSASGHAHSSQSRSQVCTINKSGTYLYLTFKIESWNCHLHVCLLSNTTSIGFKWIVWLTFQFIFSWFWDLCLRMGKGWITDLFKARETSEEKWSEEWSEEWSEDLKIECLVIFTGRGPMSDMTGWELEIVSGTPPILW